MKNRPVSGSPYCWLSTILAPRSARNCATASTIPVRSGARQREHQIVGQLATLSQE